MSAERNEDLDLDGEIHTGIKRFTLVFSDPEMEKHYRERVWRNNKLLPRIGLGVFLFFYLLGLIGDIISTKRNKGARIAVRSVACIAMILFIALSFHSQTVQQYFLGSVIILIAISANLDYIISSKYDTLFWLGITNSVLIIFLLTISKLRFLIAAGFTVLILILHNMTILVIDLTIPEAPADYFTWNWFYIFTLPLLMISAYTNELYLRREWRYRQEIKDRAIDKLKSRQDRELGKAKTRFVANVSHELRTPLHGVIGMASSLKETSLTEGQRECVDIIHSSAEALVSITNDILDLARIEQKDENCIIIEKTNMRLREIIENVMDISSQRGFSKGLDIGHFIDEGIPQRIRGDPSRVRQVILNLVGNAIKFSQSGYVILTSHVTETDLLVRVTDSGEGIKAEEQEAIFQRFYQSEGSQAKEGTGLGLYISKMIVEKCGGTIGMESKEGVGSSFWFSIPIEMADSDEEDEGDQEGEESKEEEEDKEKARPAPPKLCKRVGVIHPCEPVRKCIVNYLCQQNHEVIDTESFEELSKDLSAPLDVIFVAVDSVTLPQDISTVSTSIVGISSKRNGLSQQFPFPIIFAPVKNVHLVQAIEGRLSDPKYPTPPLEQSTPQKLRVLVAEDNLVNQKVVKNILEKNGCTVTIVDNGLKAVEAVKKETFDVVLMDFQMPVMDGIRATKEIRSWERQSDTSRVPIIALTANGTQLAEESGKEAGKKAPSDLTY